MKPVLITRHTIAKQAADDFRRVRTRTTVSGDPYLTDADARALAALEVLGPDPDPDEVNRIVGSEWVQLYPCNGCEQRVDVLVGVGADGEDGGSAYLCAACIHEAAALLPKPSDG